jgi:hypothetical protein
MISRIEKVTVYVESQESAKRFWLEKIGFVVALEQPMGPGMTWLEVGPKGEGLTVQTLPFGRMFSFRDQDGNRYMVRG